MLDTALGSCGQGRSAGRAALVLALIGVLHEIRDIRARGVVAREVRCDEEVGGVEREVLDDAWHCFPCGCGLEFSRFGGGVG